MHGVTRSFQGRSVWQSQPHSPFGFAAISARSRQTGYSFFCCIVCCISGR
jgi:hypothetical protein